MPRLRGVTPEGCVPFTPMPNEPTLKVAVLPRARRKPLNAMSKHEPTRMSI